MDTVFGLSMAKVMDPVSSVQASVWGQMLNMLFVLYFCNRQPSADDPPVCLFI